MTEMKIFYNGNLVGRLKNHKSDMWYIEGEWFPEKSVNAKTFDTLFRLQNFEKNFSEMKGVLIGWSENEEMLDGLAFGITGNIFVFRMIIQQKSKEILLQERKIINLGSRVAKFS